MFVRCLMARGLVVLSLATAPLSVAAHSLADALAAGYENSGLLDQNRALLRAADEDVAQAVAALMPVVTWAANATLLSPRTPAGDIFTASVRLSAELTIYDGGRTQLAIDAQKELVLATRQSLLDVEQQILLRIVRAYMDVRRYSEFVSLRQSNVRLITQELRAAEDRFEVGEVTRTDVSLAEARLALARSQLAAAEGDLAQANAEFLAAVGVPSHGLEPAGPVNITQSLAEARAIALRTHPQLLEAQFNVSVAELNILRAETALGPTVTLQGTLSVDQDFEDSASLGINAGGPVYQGGLLASQVRQAMARRDAARAALIVTAQQIEQGVSNAFAFLEVARASSDAFERQVRAATVAFQGIREEATLGARTTLDVLNAEQELLDARTSLISAQIDETIASYQLLAAMGLLTAEHLRLDVQLYDPSAYYNLVDDAPTATSEQGQALDRVLEALGEN